MDAAELRKAFIDFFVERGHTPVPSASLIPVDPTLLFTVAGMVPFKPYFVGEETPPYKRAVSSQKCVRAGGKHNDLDEIGRTSRHFSFFEMLGNFSFGDYFKSDAIPMAWEFVTEVLGLDPDRLWVTVHVSDDDAAQIWQDAVGFPVERIQRLDADNFWRAGDTGPCGPSSEIFWDMGPEFGSEGGPEHGSEDRYIEIWNLVFMQFDQKGPDERVDLPKPSIDTGAGLERLLMVLQNVDSVFDTDALRPLIAVAEEVSGVEYGSDDKSDVSLRILAEHGRAVTHLVADGVFPSNEQRGYVLRRILRRAVRHAYLLGVEKPVMAPLVDATVVQMGEAYPVLVSSHDFVRQVIEREEVRFRETLRTGSQILDDALAALPAGGELSGAVAFQLHDTFGFPLEVTMEIAVEGGYSVDSAGFDEEMRQQRDRARADQAGGPGSNEFIERHKELVDQFGPTIFIRDDVEATARVLAVLGPMAVTDPDGDGEPADSTGDLVYEVFTDRTPFYAEGGGQLGDVGSVAVGSILGTVVDTSSALPGLTRHLVTFEGDPVKPGDEVTLSVDRTRRDRIRRNHTATHVLHWALREVLGDHVKQQGSLVAPDYLRFDFSHYEGVTPEQVRQIEDLANAQVLENHPVRHYETTKDEAVSRGAIAFFGEKYGDIVRVLEAGPHSTELCGGTHVGATGDIGPVKIISEGSIASNQRRIVALTGDLAIKRFQDDEQTLANLADLLGVAVDDVVDGAQRRVDEVKSLKAELKALRKQAAQSRASSLADDAVDGVVIARLDGMTRDDLRDLAVSLRDQPDVRAVVLGGAPEGGGVALVSAVAVDSDFHAGELIAEASKLVKGGGGKNPDIAVAGGKDPSQLDAALDAARSAAGVPV